MLKSQETRHSNGLLVKWKIKPYYLNNKSELLYLAKEVENEFSMNQFTFFTSIDLKEDSLLKYRTLWYSTSYLQEEREYDFSKIVTLLQEYGSFERVNELNINYFHFLPQEYKEIIREYTYEGGEVSPDLLLKELGNHLLQMIYK